MSLKTQIWNFETPNFMHMGISFTENHSDLYFPKHCMQFLLQVLLSKGFSHLGHVNTLKNVIFSAPAHFFHNYSRHLTLV